MNDTYKGRCQALIIKGWFCDNMYFRNNNKLLTTHVIIENMQRLICFLTAVHKKISHNVHKVTENHLHLHLLLGILGYILWCWNSLLLRWLKLINLEITFKSDILQTVFSYFIGLNKILFVRRFLNWNIYIFYSINL